MIVRELSLSLFPDFANLHNPYVQVVNMYMRCLECQRHTVGPLLCILGKCDGETVLIKH